MEILEQLFRGFVISRLHLVHGQTTDRIAQFIALRHLLNRLLITQSYLQNNYKLYSFCRKSLENSPSKWNDVLRWWEWVRIEWTLGKETSIRFQSDRRLCHRYCRPYVYFATSSSRMSKRGLHRQQHPLPFRSLPFPEARSGFSKELERGWQGGKADAFFLRSPLIRFKGSAWNRVVRSGNNSFWLHIVSHRCWPGCTERSDFSPPPLPLLSAPRVHRNFNKLSNEPCSRTLRRVSAKSATRTS